MGGDGVQAVVPIQHREPGGPTFRDLSAELRSDRSARARHQHATAMDQRLDRCLSRPIGGRINSSSRATW